jgi:hypothetical protein
VASRAWCTFGGRWNAVCPDICPWPSGMRRNVVLVQPITPIPHQRTRRARSARRPIYFSSQSENRRQRLEAIAIIIPVATNRRLVAKIGPLSRSARGKLQTLQATGRYVGTLDYHRLRRFGTMGVSLMWSLAKGRTRSRGAPVFARHTHDSAQPEPSLGGRSTVRFRP